MFRKYLRFIAASVAVTAAFAQTPAPQAASPYTLTVFAAAPPNLSAPDSIAVVHDHFFLLDRKFENAAIVLGARMRWPNRCSS